MSFNTGFYFKMKKCALFETSCIYTKFIVLDPPWIKFVYSDNKNSTFFGIRDRNYESSLKLRVSLKRLISIFIISN